MEHHSIGVIKGVSRSLDYGSYSSFSKMTVVSISLLFKMKGLRCRGLGLRPSGSRV